jgi:hypothetical protein
VTLYESVPEATETHRELIKLQGPTQSA